MSQLPELSNNPVRTSRAGDVFHYRWAARRCLKLIYPNSTLQRFVVEGSLENNEAGEYNIDVSEYSTENGQPLVTYFQLKHTSKRADQPFVLSDLENTIQGFADRFRVHENDPETSKKIKFALITNRQVSHNLKIHIQALATGQQVPVQVQQTIQKYTNLQGESLQRFCSKLELVDSESDYLGQHYKLQAELSQISAEPFDLPDVDKFVALIQSKVLPDNDGEVKREEILSRFGVTSDRAFFPAPAEIQEIPNLFRREQHEELLRSILETPQPIIIHAGGGVGKSVVALQLSKSLPKGSVGIAYDCFGAGKYRNRSEPRHQHRVFCLQITNELAALGLCEPLIPSSTSTNEALMRTLLQRLQSAALALQKLQPEAVLTLLIDAADNAEMAAQEFGEPCFAHELLKENVPNGCRIVALCRTERISLLQPKSTVRQVELRVFSEAESLQHLRSRFVDATEYEGQEFHRLSNMNPRVQANAFGKLGDGATIESVLAGFGTSPISVDEQIHKQLESAVAALQDQLPVNYHDQIESICRGLANLPPFIPIEVLARAANVPPELISSFASDLGRPLYLTNSSVNFRDEPTETWFRQRYAASPDLIGQYATQLKPLAKEIPYVASVLPSLLHQSGQYDELIQLALSETFLPSKPPIDARNIRVYRLQFALKAALNKKRYLDAAKLAFRAAEETAGKNREIRLLTENLDLIAPLQSSERVQELAFRRMLRGQWNGSENIYSASLLSQVEDFKGDSRGFLRSAWEWLYLYFKERAEKEKENPHAHMPDLTIQDIGEMASTTLHLDGLEASVNFINTWTPTPIIFEITGFLVRRLIDAGCFETIERFAEASITSPYVTLAICNELSSVGRHLKIELLQSCLTALIKDPSMCLVSEKESYNQKHKEFRSAILALAESCTFVGLNREDIVQMLEVRFPERIKPFIVSLHSPDDLCDFIRFLAIRAVLKEELNPNLLPWLPAEWIGEKLKYDQKQKKEEFDGVFAYLFPWFLIRAQIIVEPAKDWKAALENMETNSKRLYRTNEHLERHLTFDVAQIRFECWTFAHRTVGLGEEFVKTLLEGSYCLRFKDQLNAIRVAKRLDHFSAIKLHLELACRQVVQFSTDSPEEIAQDYIQLARAVLSTDPDDATAYFESAIEAVSKFGDEVVDRWRAVTAMAERASEETQTSAETAYRYIRCAELVGESVIREKHWDRNEAIEVCFQLHPASGFTALSRWRERHIGQFERLLPDLAQAAVRSGVLSAAVSWSLSSFSWQYDYLKFAILCIENEPEKVRKQFIFDTAIRDLRLQDKLEDWDKLRDIAERFSLQATEVQKVLDFQARQPIRVSSDTLPKSSTETDDLDWSELLEGLDLSSGTGLSEANRRFRATTNSYRYNDFWHQVFSRVPESNAKRLLEELLLAEALSKHDIQEAIQALPDSWKQKISVQQYLPVMAREIGKQFAASCCVHWSRKLFVDALGTGQNYHKQICDGVIESLGASSELTEAGILFGFCEIIASYITSAEAHQVLLFALERFELHVTNAHADGTWTSDLEPPEGMAETIAGFFWSALGSPRSAERWQAAHGIRRLAGTGCQPEIDALVAWMVKDKVVAFGSPKYPFYNLHARLYLLIAFSRIALDHPNMLIAHKGVFEHYALRGETHILIQKYAAKIALLIEAASPGIYSKEIVSALQSVGVSPFLIQKTESDPSGTVRTPWHLRGEVDLTLDQLVGYDFDYYWYPELARVFGTHGDQVTSLARDLIFRKWKVQCDDRVIVDPRRELWDYSRVERETWHTHNDYPRSDTYPFYLSYHALLEIAAKMLTAMPIVQKDYDDDEDDGRNVWDLWLQQHDLTRSDGRWLADRRDPAPLKRPGWLHEVLSETWRDDVGANEHNFLEGLLMDRNGNTWLCIDGYWVDGDRERKETFYVSSALVTPSTSQALLNALSTCLDPHDFKLPELDEERMQFKIPPFELQGWTKRDSTSKMLDDHDPHAGNITYPPYFVDSEILEQFSLTADQENQIWTFENGTEAIICELWGQFKKRDDQDDTEREGSHLFASLEFLKMLCKKVDCLLIIEVQIRRSQRRKEGHDGYRPPANRVYLLSADGKLRTTTASYQLREKTGTRTES